MTLRRVTALSFFAALLAGLAPGARASADLFAAIPGSPSGSVLRFSGTSGAGLGSFVAPGAGGLRIPAGMTFGPDGNLYVADGDSGVLRYNGVTGAFLDVFVSRIANGGIAPRALSFGPDGNLYTSAESSDVTLGGVNRFSGADGHSLGALVPLGGGIGMDPIHNFTFGPDGNLYVTSFSFGGVRRFNGKTGAFMDVFVPPGGNNQPADVAFAPDGSLYVSENQTGVIEHYSGANGLLLGTLTPIVGTPHFNLEGLKFGPDGNLYVTDYSASGGGVFRFNGQTGAFMDVFIPASQLSSPYIVFGPCATGQGSLCAADGRFRITAAWRTTTGQSGIGQPGQLTGDTGDFWFFDSSNIEALAKVLNGCGVNGHFWFFAGGLTNVNVTLKVEDTKTGRVKTYTNPQNSVFVPIQDTAAFATCTADDLVEPPPSDPERIEPAASAPAESSIDSDPSCAGLCLDNGRFAVSAHWLAGAQSGSANGVELTPDTGYLWFFDASNVEAVVKVLDGCGINGHYWVFAGGLTNVEVDLTITDSTTGRAKTYHNPANTAFRAVQDTSAFAAGP